MAELLLVAAVFEICRRMTKYRLTMISNAKSFIQGTYHGMERKHIDLYLAEFCFRFNRRHFHEMLYQRLMIAALDAPICRYNRLVNSLADSK